MDGSNRIAELEQKFAENPRRFFAPLANEYRKAGNPQRAMEICRAHLGQMPGHMSGQIVYGQALFECGDYRQARTVFENALAMDRENLIVLRHLGDLAMRDGDSAEAKQWYSRLLEIDPKDSVAISLVNEIDAAAGAGRTQDLVETASEAAQPEFPGERHPTPGSEQPLEEQPTAVADYDEMGVDDLDIPTAPPQAFVTETMAELYLSQGFFDRGLETYQQLADLHPENEKIRARLAELGAAGAPTVSRYGDYEPVEAPEPAPDEHRATSTEEPAIATPAGTSASEETPDGEAGYTDSPPAPEPASEEESVESPIADEPRAAPEGIAAKQRTVREFFAILGSRKPARALDRLSGSDGNGRPHRASESFFSAAPAEDDRRAAVALAGAFSVPSASYQSSAAAETAQPVRQTAVKESEEDMARFRAWLDGLTNE